MKDAKDLMPAGERRDKIERLVAEVDAKIPAAEAQLARGLGYLLCRCTWPPQIMLETGTPPRPRCGRCGRDSVGGLGQLSKEQERVLQLLTERSQPGFSSAEVAQRIGLTGAKAEYYLEEFNKSEMVTAAYAMGSPPEYFLGQRGREYLVQQGLL